jgi:hypothetical protein
VSITLQPLSNCNNSNNNNDTILIINKVPVTGTNVSRTARKAKSKVPGMTHTTKYDTTSTRSNISLAHETSMDTLSKSWDSSDRLISKYTTTEKHISTGKPKASKLLKSSSTQPNISVAHEKVGVKELKSCESSQTGSKILITHDNLTQFHMPQVIENTDCDKPFINRVIIIERYKQ